MKSAIAPSETNQTKAQAESPIDAKVAKLEAQEKEIQAELTAFLNSLDQSYALSRKVGPIGIERLAIACGESVGKLGRPSQKAFTPFAMVLINWRDKDGNRMGFKQRNRLYELAQKAVGSRKGDEGYYSPANDEELKKARAAFVKSAGKGSDDTATIRLRMARPASEEIALGE